MGSANCNECSECDALTTTSPAPTPPPIGACATIPHPGDLDQDARPPCVFPFKSGHDSNGAPITRNGCLRYWGGYWCPTKVNVEGVMEEWGDCAPSCPRDD